MRTILRLSASPRGSQANSHRFSDQVIARLKTRHPGAELIDRDLSSNPPPLIDAGFSAAILGSADRSAPALRESERLIAELENTDALVIATPMHNFSTPAVLKAWIDQIVRIHRSFGSTPQGKVGLLSDRPVYLVLASGGWFTGAAPVEAPRQPDFLTPYLTTVLNTIGLRDLHVFALEGLARGDAMRDAAFARAEAALNALLPLP